MPDARPIDWLRSAPDCSERAARGETILMSIVTVPEGPGTAEDYEAANRAIEQEPGCLYRSCRLPARPKRLHEFLPVMRQRSGFGERAGVGNGDHESPATG